MVEGGGEEGGPTVEAVVLGRDGRGSLVNATVVGKFWGMNGILVI